MAPALSDLQPQSAPKATAAAQTAIGDGLVAEAQAFSGELAAWRHDLHQMPELGNSLPQTSAYIQARLTEMDIPFATLVDGSCVVGLVGAGAAAAQNAAAARKKLIPALPDKYNTPNAIIAKVILVALLSVWVSSLFHDAVNKLVWCLIFGVLCKELGFLDEDALGKAHATGIVMPIITLSIFTNLASATPEMVGGMVVPLLVCVVIGTVAFSVVSILVGKIFGYSWQMSMAIGSSCLFGFPGTVIISNEVSESTGANAEERAAINAQIMPKMLVAGMVTVSITSVLVAGVMSSWL